MLRHAIDRVDTWILRQQPKMWFKVTRAVWQPLNLKRHALIFGIVALPTGFYTGFITNEIVYGISTAGTGPTAEAKAASAGMGLVGGLYIGTLIGLRANIYYLFLPFMLPKLLLTGLRYCL